MLSSKQQGTLILCIWLVALIVGIIHGRQVLIDAAYPKEYYASIKECQKKVIYVQQLKQLLNNSYNPKTKKDIYKLLNQLEVKFEPKSTSECFGEE